MGRQGGTTISSIGQVAPRRRKASEDYACALDLVAGATGIVVLSGAGISTDSGIPDYRGPNGTWTRNPPARAAASLADYLADGQLRRRQWRSRLDAPIWRAAPNVAHRCLVDLEVSGRLELVVTQNTDGLHRLAGQDPSLLVEIHGTTRRTDCLACGASLPTELVLERVRAGEDDPRCAAAIGPAPCGGVLKVATVGFGQPVDRGALERAGAAVRQAGLLLVVGSTLKVEPVAGLVPLAIREGVPVVIVNDGETRYDALATARVAGPIAELLPALLAGERHR